LKNKIKLNTNSESFVKWIFRAEDELSSVVFIFISIINANNARFFPLFQNSNKIRFVYFKGLPLKYSDRICIKIFAALQMVFKKKIERYQTIHFFNTKINFKNRIQILHIDDPEYTKSFENNLKMWEEKNAVGNRVSRIICTNSFTQNWLSTIVKFSEIHVIEQGLNIVPTSKMKERKSFICAYSSPYICYGKDKNSNHSAYGADILIDEIIPGLLKRDKKIMFYIIGRVGKHAREKLEAFPNVKLFGLVGTDENEKILSYCDVGLYSRKFDHKRSVLKIFSYLGSGLPVVTFDLIDTEIIKLEKFGFSVSTTSQFIDRVIELKESPQTYRDFQSIIFLNRKKYTWKSLAQKMDNLIYL